MDQLELSIYIYVLSIINLFFNYLEIYLSISLISLSLKQIICYRLSEIDGSIRTFYIYMFFQLLIFFFQLSWNLSIYLTHLTHTPCRLSQMSEIGRSELESKILSFNSILNCFHCLEIYLSISLSLQHIICYRLSEIDGSIRTFSIKCSFNS